MQSTNRRYLYALRLSKFTYEVRTKEGTTIQTSERVMSEFCVARGCKRRVDVILVKVGCNFYLCDRHNQLIKENKPVDFKSAFKRQYYPEMEFKFELDSAVPYGEINL